MNDAANWNFGFLKVLIIQASDDSTGGDICGWIWRGNRRDLRPALAFAEFGNVGGMVAAVPGVYRSVDIERHYSSFRMIEISFPVHFRQRLEKLNPSSVQTFEK